MHLAGDIFHINRDIIVCFDDNILDIRKIFNKTVLGGTSTIAGLPLRVKDIFMANFHF